MDATSLPNSSVSVCGGASGSEITQIGCCMKTPSDGAALTGQEERHVLDQVLGVLFRLWIEQPHSEVVVNDHLEKGGLER